MSRDLFAPRDPPAAHAFTVIARAAKRWRGPSFDAYDAQARLGVALAEALGVNVRDKAAVDAFLSRTVIRSERSAEDPNPVEPFDPAVGESWRFHVRFLDEVPEERLRAAKDAAVAAVDAARNYSAARVVDESP